MAVFEKYHVASGSCYWGSSQPRLLQAFLGTCVGVALYDTQADIGGLIHLLLPEPVSCAPPQVLEKYASSGLPLFLEALYRAGAAREQLKATVAGGALVGPVGAQDLALNIGGRTTDVVKKILASEGLQVEKSETGGFFSCCLSLNMQDWQSSIAPVGQERLAKNRKALLPVPHQIEHAINQLLPIPQVALKILKIVDDDTYDIGQMAQEVRKDQVISAKTLQLCNSSLYFRRTPIDTLDHALVLLGQYLFLQLVISAALKGFFDQSSLGYSICKGGLYHHAVGTALIAEKLARLTEKVPPALAYTAGLLHDIGKVVLDQYITPVYPMFYRELQGKQKQILAVEKKILGIDHSQVGCRLAAMWSLPESLSGAIEHHHQPEADPVNPELTHIVYLADLLMTRFHAGLEMDRQDTARLPSRLERIGLSASRFADIVDLIPDKVFGAEPELAFVR